ncbi:MAG: HD domain-containing protein [Anaerolineaceae bacterium]
MNLPISAEARQVVEAVRTSKPANLTVYLVGGAVRDLILGKPVKDFDFVSSGFSLELARKVRKRLRAVGYTLDDERQTARLIVNQGEENELILDFVCFVGETLEEDLKNRDFTINTMVINLDQPDLVIDPLNGQKDLDEKRLRAASEASMQLDPLRVLRGARMKIAYDLEIEPKTKLQMQVAAPELARVSGERIRDELFKILEYPQCCRSLMLLDDLGSLTQVFPELLAVKQVPAFKPHVHPLWEHTLRVIQYLEIMLFPGGQNGVDSVEPYLEVLKSKLSPYLERLQVMFATPIQGKRPRWSLLVLAALYHDIGKPLTYSQDEVGRHHFYGHDQAGSALVVQRAQALALGNEETQYLANVVGQHMRVHFIVKPGAEISDRVIYRYFRDLGETGLDVALLSLADTLAAFENTRPMEKWQLEVNAVVTLLEAWFARKNAVILPEKLLDGDDIQEYFQLKPGPILGEVLEALSEAQASGDVVDRQEALAFIAAFLGNIDGKGV